ncbi:DNA polymerase III subunit alpha [Jeotgalibacillus soli]|uniref:DNA polymerase III subunit alpha n=1 Tax=Jeotgalibacillus soli TaxID=889306 RepID=A0A0C2RPY6_9BACL|nr:DNA polymerase III subunit alpha [Jeotgalibacillus soli]KIL43829.1 DNA polymerase III subunit epsilon [Jeotgalibacillus soli]
MSFVHLQLTSSFDLLSSTITLSALMDKAQKERYEAVALTDRNVLYGVVPFYKACKKAGIKPIIGMTADVRIEEDEKAFPLVLLARNQQGYKNLIKISSVLQTKSTEGIPHKWLKSYANGLIALTPGVNGEIEQLIEKGLVDQAIQCVRVYQQMFGDDSFFLSLQNHGLQRERERMEQLTVFANEYNLRVVATHDVRYLEEDDAFPYRVATAIRDGEKIEDDDSDGGIYSFASKGQMVERFSSIPEALQTTIEIAERCQVELAFGEMQLPKFPVPDDVSAGEVLEHLCREGLQKRLGQVPPAYEQRIVHELTIIDRMSFSDYFLIVWDFMKFARENKILTGPGRGSAAGSLVAYALFITQVDPIEHDLLFERFLNPERVTMPDIDIDFPDHRRDEVIHYVAEKYGALHVAQILTFGTLSAKAVARDTARVFGFSNGELEVISRSIPGRTGIVLGDALKESSKLRQFVEQSARHQLWFEVAQKLEGLPRHTSTHAAGVIISDRPLIEIVPLQKGHDQVHMTQWPMDILEAIGLLKMDFLGLRNLTILERIVQSVKQKENRNFQLEDMPSNDSKTFELLSKGWTTGVFQLESDGMKNVLSTLKPTSFEDIVAVNALYRPGPMDHIPSFVNRKHGKEKVNYIHEDLRPILSRTYGILVYQEQIMEIAAVMAGFSLGQADLLRRAVSKKKKEDLDRERARFVEGSIERGYDEKTAHIVYDLIVRFADYGFNRSHAVAYSLIGYQLAFLKTHYPTHFMAALMTSVTGNEDKLRLYIRESKRLGLNILPPSIQSSHRYFAVEKDSVRFSISAIKGIGAATARDLLEARKKGPFKDLFDLCVRVPAKSMNRKILESLVLSGALDDFSKDRATLLATIDVAIEHASLMNPSEESFFDDIFNISPKYIEKAPMPTEVKLTYEKEVLGVYLTAHPVTSIQEKLNSIGATSIDQLKAGQRSVIIGALITDIRMIRTKKGESMAFVVCSDDTGDLDAVAFPETYRHASGILKEGLLVIFRGKIEERNGKHQLVIQEIKLPEDWINNESNSKLFIRIPSQVDQEATIRSVRELCRKHKGETAVIIHIEESGRTLQLQRSEWVNPHAVLPSQLKRLLGDKNVIIQ